MTRYAYTRISFKLHNIEIVVGVPAYTGHNSERSYQHVRNTLQAPIYRLLDQGLDDKDLAHAVEHLIKMHWSGGSYFIEVGRGKLDEWIQVFEDSKDNYPWHPYSDQDNDL